MDLILDTNIYRNLVRNLADDEVIHLSRKIKQKCKQDNIRLLFPINSAMELISHFDDASDVDRIECKSALRLLVDLSTTYSSTHIHVDFIPPLNAILERFFIGVGDKNARMYAKVINLAQMLVGNIEDLGQAEMTRHVQTVRGQIEFEKREIRDNYEGYLKSINNGDADWKYYKDKKELRSDYFKSLRIGRLSFLVAQGFIDRAHSIAGKSPVKNEEYYNTVIEFMKKFCPALIMNERLLENVGNSVEAIKDVADRRWNTVIDISIIFGALYNPTNLDKRLVTEEKNIHAAFNECGFQDKILDLAQFKVLMGL
ncbi:hypothetical protein [uncultured Chitinophaga sp.]|uniref:hypothetical protein n=1 Tax=uncultured Chitinophaga sp. TaxID=339340 RepID=UPI0025F543CD|nr:hypothetical protein [uncultured Chitinophaga sp.]